MLLCVAVEGCVLTSTALINWIIDSAWWFGERGEGCGDGFSVTSRGDSWMAGFGNSFGNSVLKLSTPVLGSLFLSLFQARTVVTVFMG